MKVLIHFVLGTVFATTLAFAEIHIGEEKAKENASTSHLTGTKLENPVYCLGDEGIKLSHATIPDATSPETKKTVEGDKLRLSGHFEIDDWRNEVFFFSDHGETYKIPGEASRYRCLLGFEYDAVMNVTGIASQNVLTGKLLELKVSSMRNPPSTRVADAKDMAPITVEGTVLEVVPAIKSQDSGYLRIRTHDDRIIQVVLEGGYVDVPAYRNSLSPEIDSQSISGKPLELGDRVRLPCEKLRGAIGCGRTAFLVSPSLNRSANYQGLKAANTADFASIRQARGNDLYEDVRGHLKNILKREPTRKEFDRAQEVLNEFPDNERPIPLDKHAFHTAEEVNKAFGKDPTFMPESQVVGMAKDFASRKLKPQTERIYSGIKILDYLLASGWGKKNPREYVDILKAATRSRMNVYQQTFRLNEKLTRDDYDTLAETVRTLGYQLDSGQVNEDDRKFVNQLRAFKEKYKNRKDSNLPSWHRDLEALEEKVARRPL